MTTLSSTKTKTVCIDMKANESNAKPTLEGTTMAAVERRGQKPVEPLIFEKSRPGRIGVTLPELDVPACDLPDSIMGSGFNGAEVGQLDVVRHYARLSQRNFSVDANFYPLGSCTMKYNPRINEWAAAHPGLCTAHPMQRVQDIQGLLGMMYEVRTFLEEISGLDEVCLQPAAGAHGEYTALRVMRAYFRDNGQPERVKVLAPDTAHGTNPASCAMCGAGVITIPSTGGYTDVDAVRRAIDEQGPDTIAGVMLTNPNTAGLFDAKVDEIAEVIHEAGGLVYIDGANMNAILGKTRPGEFGADAMHYNTHKTFSTPHGCGGPGAGPIAVRDFLAPYLPVPQVVMNDEGQFDLEYDRPKSIGKVRSFFAQTGVLIRCWAYIRACGPDGLRNVAETAVLNANYLGAILKDRYEMPYFDPDNGKYCAHEFITVPKKLLAHGVSLVDIAKRLIDFEMHPPTMHWPVHDCLMVEPTETEPKETLDRFAAVMLAIADEIESDPDSIKAAPEDATVNRLDEVGASRKPILVWEEDNGTA